MRIGTSAAFFWVGLGGGILAGSAGCDGGPRLSDPDLGVAASAPAFHSSCEALPTTEEARRPAGRLADGTVILPGGRRLSPVGKVIEVGGFQLALAGQREGAQGGGISGQFGQRE